MVKKRSRTNRSRKSFRETYDSEDNDSDVDLNLPSAPSPPPPPPQQQQPPQPRRYGLRQRKQPVFFPDYHCDDEEEEDDPVSTINNTHSDDDEYHIEDDLKVVKTKPIFSARSSSKRHRNNNKKKPVVHDKNETVIKTVVKNSNIQLDSIGGDTSTDNNDLIDFEDVIRADVVNRQITSGENLKNDPKIEQNNKNNVDNVSTITRNRVRRGRKRKVPEDDFIDTNDIDLPDAIKQFEEDDMQLEVQIDPATLVQSDDSDDDKPLIRRRVNGKLSKHNSIPKNNAHKRHHQIDNDISGDDDNDDDDNDDDNNDNDNDSIVLAESWVDKIEKFVPPKLDENEKEVLLSNEYLLANVFDVGADEFRENQDKFMNLPLANDSIYDTNIQYTSDHSSFDIDYNDDDSSDVIIIEKAPEIIVLDDD